MINFRSERKHKGTIPFADKNIDQMGSIIHGELPLEMRNDTQNRLKIASRSSYKDKISINNDFSQKDTRRYLSL
jgi:hypothetical protein